MDGWMGGWVDGWMGGWVGVKAGLRIAYSNQKTCELQKGTIIYASIHHILIIINLDRYPQFKNLKI